MKTIMNEKKGLFVNNSHDYDFMQTTENNKEVFRLFSCKDESWTTKDKSGLIIKSTIDNFTMELQSPEQGFFNRIIKANNTLILNCKEATELELMLRIIRGNLDLSCFALPYYQTI
jgi:hypothetical protein